MSLIFYIHYVFEKIKTNKIESNVQDETKKEKKKLKNWNKEKLINNETKNTYIHKVVISKIRIK